MRGFGLEANNTPSDIEFPNQEDGLLLVTADDPNLSIVSNGDARGWKSTMTSFRVVGVGALLAGALFYFGGSLVATPQRAGLEDGLELAGYSCATGQGQSGKNHVDISANSEEGCSKKCYADENCVGFDYTTKSQYNSCRLYGPNTPRTNGGGDNRKYCTMAPAAVSTVAKSPPTSLPDNAVEGYRKMVDDMISNSKSIHDQEREEREFKNLGQDCWSQCRPGGQCTWCGRHGACCRKDGRDSNQAECKNLDDDAGYTKDNQHQCVKMVEKSWEPGRLVLADKAAGFCFRFEGVINGAHQLVYSDQRTTWQECEKFCMGFGRCYGWDLSPENICRTWTEIDPAGPPNPLWKKYQPRAGWKAGLCPAQADCRKVTGLQPVSKNNRAFLSYFGRRCCNDESTDVGCQAYRTPAMSYCRMGHGWKYVPHQIPIDDTGLSMDGCDIDRCESDEDCIGIAWVSLDKKGCYLIKKGTVLMYKSDWDVCLKATTTTSRSR